MAKTFGDREIIVSPVTLATRFGPYPAGPAGPGDLPPPVDVRQPSLLGAAWTVGSLAALALAGAASVTWYETTGWRGVIETDAGSPMRDLFPSRPGQAFPMYHAFADVAEWKAGTVRATRCSDPLRAVALCVEQSAATHLLVANVTPERQLVRVVGVRGERALVRMVDETSTPLALDDPVAFRADRGSPLVVTDHELALDLAPFALARLDLTM
jgi:hypothetical protein